MNRRRKLALALVSIPLACLVGEGLARAIFAAQGEPYRAAEARQRLIDTRSAVIDRIPDLQAGTGRLEERGGVTLGLHPYTGWEVFDDQIPNEIKRYERGDYGQAFEVLVLGGSVAGLTASKGGRAILSTLHADPRLDGQRVALLHHGRGSYKQPQMTMKAAWLFSLGYRPDAVVLIDGFNEVALGMDNITMDAHPLFPHWGKYGPIAGSGGMDREQIRRYAGALQAQDAIAAEVDRALAWRLYESAVLGHFVQSRIYRLRARWTDLQNQIVEHAGGGEDALRHPARGNRFEGGPDAGLEVIVDTWVESSIQLDALCRAHGIPFLHVLQPTLHDQGSKPLTEEELHHGGAKPSWIEGARRGYPRLREASSRIVDAGVAFLDLSGIFRELSEETYYDACHFRGAGMDLFATRIAERLLDELP